MNGLVLKHKEESRKLLTGSVQTTIATEKESPLSFRRLECLLVK